MAAAAAKIPAWKRLGLQLKSGRDTTLSAPVDTSSSNLTTGPSTPTLGKRKLPAGEEAPVPGRTVKLARRDDGLAPRTATGRPARAASSSSNTRSTRVPSQEQAAPTEKPRVAKASKANKKTPAKAPRTPPNLSAAIEYLRQWRDTRRDWKFNKNHQTMMIKYAFEDGGVLPASETDTFYRYISDLKGFSRTRLRESAKAVRDKDVAAKEAGFAEGVKNAEGKQEKYEAMVTSYTTPKSAGERYSEEQFLATKVDKFIVTRLVKRMRAEMVLQALAESEGDKDSSEGAQEEEEDTSRSTTAPAATEGRRKAARSRKSRTAVAEESSDSSSEEEAEEEDG